MLRYSCVIIHACCSPSPDGGVGRYTVNVTIDGKTIAELGGSCGGCWFEVSYGVHQIKLQMHAYVHMSVCVQVNHNKLLIMHASLCIT